MPPIKELPLLLHFLLIYALVRNIMAIFQCYGIMVEISMVHVLRTTLRIGNDKEYIYSHQATNFCRKDMIRAERLMMLDHELYI